MRFQTCLPSKESRAQKSTFWSYRQRLPHPANEDEFRRRLERPPQKEYELTVVLGLRTSGESPDSAASALPARTQALAHGVDLIRFAELAQFGMKLIGVENSIATSQFHDASITLLTEMVNSLCPKSHE
jgi:hypothetical protein